MTIRTLHAYKSYKPEQLGGVAEVIANLLSDGDHRFSDSLLVARIKGVGRLTEQDGVKVRAMSSIGTIASTPISPMYPIAIGRAARHADLLVHHFPFPLTDIGLATTVPSTVPVIMHWHADIVRSKSVMKLIGPLIRHSIGRAARIIVSHQSIIEQSNVLSHYTEKCIVIPYGLDVKYWSALTSEQAAKVSRVRSQFPRLVLSVGRLVSYKGYSDLLKAMVPTDATLIIVGEGPLESALRRQAQSLGVGGRTLFVGRLDRDELKILMHAACVFALPSNSPAESFGLVQVEAMACGLPIVNTDIPTAVPHVARNRLESITVSPHSPEGLASAITSILDSLDLANRLGQAGYERAHSQYGKGQFASRVREVYFDVAHISNRRCTVASDRLQGTLKTPVDTFEARRAHRALSSWRYPAFLRQPQ